MVIRGRTIAQRHTSREALISKWKRHGWLPTSRGLIHDGKIQRLSFVPGLYQGNGPPDFFKPAQRPDIVQHMQEISAPFDTQFEVGQDDVTVVLGDGG